MKEIENIVKMEVSKFIQNAPKNDGSITGLQKRLIYFKFGLDPLSKAVNNAVNKYIADNNLDNDEVKKIEIFCATCCSVTIRIFSTKQHP